MADRVEWRHADLRTWTPGDGRFDLVTSCFLHLLDHGMLDATRQMAQPSPQRHAAGGRPPPDDEHTGLRWSLPGVI